MELAIDSLNPSERLLSHLPGMVVDCMHCSQYGSTDYDINSYCYSFAWKMKRAFSECGENPQDDIFLSMILNNCEDCKFRKENTRRVAKFIADFFIFNGYGFSFGYEG
ncbi:MAG: hypothetical protein ABIB79_05285 [archaeon]